MKLAVKHNSWHIHNSLICDYKKQELFQTESNSTIMTSFKEINILFCTFYFWQYLYRDLARWETGVKPVLQIQLQNTYNAKQEVKQRNTFQNSLHQPNNELIFALKYFDPAKTWYKKSKIFSKQKFFSGPLSRPEVRTPLHLAFWMKRYFNWHEAKLKG